MMSFTLKEAKASPFWGLSYFTTHDPTICEPTMKDSCINYVFCSMACQIDGRATAYIALKSLKISLLQFKSDLMPFS